MLSRSSFAVANNRPNSSRLLFPKRSSSVLPNRRHRVREERRASIGVQAVSLQKRNFTELDGGKRWQYPATTTPEQRHPCVSSSFPILSTLRIILRANQSPKELTSDQRLDELAAILAAGVLRLHHQSANSADCSRSGSGTSAASKIVGARSMTWQKRVTYHVRFLGHSRPNHNHFVSGSPNSCCKRAKSI